MFNPRLFGLAPFLAASWLAIDLQALIGPLGLSSDLGSGCMWALGMVAKYMFVRTVIWPGRQTTRTAAA